MIDASSDRKALPGKPLVRAARGEALERPPFWFMRQAGRYLPEYREVRVDAGSFLDLCYNPRLAAEVTLQPVRRFGTDGAILFSDILVIPHALGQHLEFREGEGPWLDPITTEAELARLSSDRIHDRLSPVYETVERVRSALPDDVALIGFAGAPWTVATYMVAGRGTPDQAPARDWAYRDPAGFQRLIEMLVDATVRYLDRQVRAGADIVQLFDSWAGGLPESAFERWVIAPTRAIVERLRKLWPDLPIIGFPRAAGAFYEPYVRATGVDVVGLDTGVPLQWAARTLQPMAAVQGNLDPRLPIVGGAAMLDEARRIMEAFSSGGHIFNLGHGFVPQTPPENVAQLADFIREWRR